MRFILFYFFTVFSKGGCGLGRGHTRRSLAACDVANLAVHPPPSVCVAKICAPATSDVPYLTLRSSSRVTRSICSTAKRAPLFPDLGGKGSSIEKCEHNRPSLFSVRWGRETDTQIAHRGRMSLCARSAQYFRHPFEISSWFNSPPHFGLPRGRVVLLALLPEARPTHSSRTTMIKAPRWQIASSTRRAGNLSSNGVKTPAGKVGRLFLTW